MNTHNSQVDQHGSLTQAQGSDSNTDVTVVICTYTDDRWDDVRDAVDSVWQQTIGAKEIVIVVDHNHDLFQRVQTHIPGARVIENAGQRGLAAARNTGISAASGSIVAFLDDDARAEADWLAQLLRHYQDPHVVGVGGLIVPRWLSGRPGWFPEEFDWVVGCTYRGMPEQSAAVRNIIGANMSFRRAPMQQVRGFSTELGRVGTLPAGCEETELCIRIRRHMPTSKIIFEPQAVVHHRVPDYRATWRYFRSRCYAEGRSKATVTAFVGHDAGLATERAYTLRTLPAGAMRGVSDAVARRRPDGIGRASTIVAGLAITGAGYLSAVRSSRRAVSMMSPNGVSSHDIDRDGRTPALK